MITASKQLGLWLVVISMLGWSCGKDDKSSSGGGKENDADLTEEEKVTENIQLKGTSLLAQSLYMTLGPSKDMSGEVDDEGKELSIFDVYGENFGQTDGLRFGEIFADSPSTSYLMALAILGHNAAQRCMEEIAYGELTLCQCDTTADAQEMIMRALPFVDAADAGMEEMASEFAKQCRTDYVGAISTLIASLAFAARS